MTETDLLEQLREMRFLQDIDDEYLRQIAAIAKRVQFPAGKVIFREGERLSQVYLIVSGSVSLEICASGLGCRRIMTVTDGDLLGISPLLEQTRLTATARTITDTTAIVLERRPDPDAVRAQPPLRLRVHAAGGVGPGQAAERHAAATDRRLRHSVASRPRTGPEVKGPRWHPRSCPSVRSCGSTSRNCRRSSTASRIWATARWGRGSAEAAVVYDDLDAIQDLPIGWIDEQDGGRYRLRRPARSA